MFEINRSPYIKIDLNPGVYSFGFNSGTGKTWLYKLAQEYQGYGEPIAGYTYRDFKLKHDPFLEFKNAKVIVIDRYDLYKGYLDNLIDSLMDKIILLDCKSKYSGNAKDRLCTLHLAAEGIEVTP